MQFMEKEAITNAVVVGHSVSGVWLQLLSVQVSHLMWSFLPVYLGEDTLTLTCASHYWLLRKAKEGMRPDFMQAAERISRIVFLDAIVLKNGESFISNSIGPAQVCTPLHRSCHDSCMAGKHYNLHLNCEAGKAVLKPSDGILIQ